MDRLEALADALMKLNGWGDPSSRSYRNRNPLLLKAYSLSRAQRQDEKGVRVFTSLLGGYRAGLHDLAEKCGGHSRSKLVREQPLHCLLGVMGAGDPIASRHVLQFLRGALPAEEELIYAGMPLGWFLQSAEARPLGEGGLQTNAILAREKAWSVSNG